jgi:hypothetical protein
MGDTLLFAHQFFLKTAGWLEIPKLASGNIARKKALTDGRKKRKSQKGDRWVRADEVPELLCRENVMRSFMDSGTFSGCSRGHAVSSHAPVIPAHGDFNRFATALCTV